MSVQALPTTPVPTRRGLRIEARRLATALPDGSSILDVPSAKAYVLAFLAR